MLGTLPSCENTAVDVHPQSEGLDPSPPKYCNEETPAAVAAETRIDCQVAARAVLPCSDCTMRTIYDEIMEKAR